jgi:hypothetical protein
MRAITIWLAAVLIGLSLCGASLAAKAKRPKVAVVVASVGVEEEGATRTASVSVIAGYVKDRGWLKSEQAGPLMKKGDRLAVYVVDPPGQRAGEVELTDNGQDMDAGEYSNEFGWVFEQVKAFRLPRGEELLGVWRTSSAPEPKWIAAKKLSSDNVVYRKEVLAWLKSRGISAAAREKTEIGQIIKADLNGDKRDEVLIAFASPGAGYINDPDVPEPRYSYLIMRYLPKGSKTVRTVILNDDKYAWHTVDALCDLDGDGWAEIVGSDGGQDYGSDFLYHWNGKRFQALSGCGGGA